MHILIDADACPNVVKEILFRAAIRLKINVTLYANRALSIPKNPLFKSVQVPGGFDEADQKIIEMVTPGDLVITADIPLASAVIEKKASALNPRGELYTLENIQQRLAVRNFMEELRNTGQVTGGPAPLNQRDQRAFANALDRFLMKAQH
ncbi:MAG TPA: YaiI/YqxD family protein [Gammaproteobacteria bacterium]|nr:YaiI/YqxD family protein [Gammaproteobacteria bacterium]